MKNFVGKLFVGRSAKFNVLLVLCLFAFVGLGCFGSGRGGKDAKPIPAAFLGDWQGQDGSTLSIRADGTGDYHSGGKKVDGGTAEVSEADKTISITFFGIGETLKIDSPPQGDTMKLNGITYKRKGGFTVADTNTSSDNSNKSENSNKKSTSTTKSNAAKYEVPEDEEMQEMTRTALLDFNDAVQGGDFTDFHSTISKTWQKQTTPEKFNEVFSEFITKKVNISGVSNRDAEYSPEPAVQMDGGAKKLIAKGCYDVSPRPVGFTLKWIPEGKVWKLFGIEVDTTIASC
jgi:hypothetical protein